MQKHCSVEGCNSYRVTTFGDDNPYCYAHLKKLDPDRVERFKGIREEELS